MPGTGSRGLAGPRLLASGMAGTGPAAAACDCCQEREPVGRGDAGWLAAAVRVRMLSWLSLAWMTAEGVIGLIAGVNEASVALIGWALGSVIEGLASVIVIWRFTGARTFSPAAESRGRRTVAVSFFLLAPYIGVAAVRALAGHHVPAPGVLGMTITAGSVVFMPALGAAKRRLAARLGSGATAGEGMQNLLCAAQGGAVLLGLAATAAWGWRWLDPVIALALAAWAIGAGITTWRGHDCC
jgi:divalent metal cation (Fe/Co/Zn/Cd) transporter